MRIFGREPGKPVAKGSEASCSAAPSNAVLSFLHFHAEVLLLKFQVSGRVCFVPRLLKVRLHLSHVDAAGSARAMELFKLSWAELYYNIGFSESSPCLAHVKTRG